MEQMLMETEDVTEEAKRIGAIRRAAAGIDDPAMRQAQLTASLLRAVAKSCCSSPACKSGAAPCDVKRAAWLLARDINGKHYLHERRMVAGSKRKVFISE